MLIRKMTEAEDKNERYAIARYLARDKAGVNALAGYINGDYESEGITGNVFADSEKNLNARKEFSTAMHNSKDFGNISKFRPELEEYINKTDINNMEEASKSVSFNASLISTASSASIKSIWNANRDNEDRRKLLIEAMETARNKNGPLKGNIKPEELATINELIGPPKDIIISHQDENQTPPTPSEEN